jgi:acetyl-CoA carboxylase carboxyl transferase subunit alpha
MLQYSIYSVISPEGCASILWKSADKAEAAAEAMGMTAERLEKLKLVDIVIPEPLGGAHRDVQATAESVKSALVHAVTELKALSLDALLAQRRRRLAGYGVYRET